MSVEWISMADRLPSKGDADMNGDVWVLERNVHKQPRFKLMHYRSLEPDNRTQLAWARTGLDREGAYAML